MFHYRKSNGEPLGYLSQRSRLIPVKTFFQWLTRSWHILYNPASELQLPRPPRKLPHHVLTLPEVETILAQPDVTTPQGLRDRAMLELLYSTGVRRMELTRLKCYDVDTDAGSVFVREGKGRKDRMIPIGHGEGHQCGRQQRRFSNLEQRPSGGPPSAPRRATAVPPSPATPPPPVPAI